MKLILCAIVLAMVVVAANSALGVFRTKALSAKVGSDIGGLCTEQNHSECSRIREGIVRKLDRSVKSQTITVVVSIMSAVLVVPLGVAIRQKTPT